MKITPSVKTAYFGGFNAHQTSRILEITTNTTNGPPDGKGGFIPLAAPGYGILSRMKSYS
jgi:hypothetical protein